MCSETPSKRLARPVLHCAPATYATDTDNNPNLKPVEYDAVKGADGKKLVIPRVSHPHSSSAGASSTRFHEYRRHREFERAYEKMLDETDKEKREQAAFHEKASKSAAEAEAKTAKRAAKRKRKKAKAAAARAKPAPAEAAPPAVSSQTADSAGASQGAEPVPDDISITSAEARELLGDADGSDLPPPPTAKRPRGGATADAGEARAASPRS